MLSGYYTDHLRPLLVTILSDWKLTLLAVIVLDLIFIAFVFAFFVGKARNEEMAYDRMFKEYRSDG